MLNKTRITGYLLNVSDIVYVSVTYIFTGFIILLIVDISYVSYCIQKNFFPVSWPLAVLRNAIKILPFLFLPMFGEFSFLIYLELFLMILSCNPTNSQNKVNQHSINRLIPTMICYENVYIIHMFLFIISAILILFMEITLTLFNFSYSLSDIKLLSW